jgi:hypothetical protein
MKIWFVQINFLANYCALEICFLTVSLRVRSKKLSGLNSKHPWKLSLINPIQLHV